MVRGIRTAVLAALIAAAAAAGPAAAGKRVIAISSSSLTTRLDNETNEVDYYVLDVPAVSGLQGKQIFGAVLELYADVSARTETLQVALPDSTDVEYIYQDEEPVLEIYALPSSYQGSIDLQTLRENPVSQQGVLPGSGRRIRVDIGPLLARFIANPNLNHGLVLGSLSGRRTGIFEIDTDGHGAGTVAKLTIFSE